MKRQKTTLKSYFETGDIPTQSQYENLIDSFRHLDDKVSLTDLDGTIAQVNIDNQFSSLQTFNDRLTINQGGIDVNGEAFFEDRIEANALIDATAGLRIQFPLTPLDIANQPVGTILLDNNSTGATAPTMAGKTNNNAPGLQFIAATRDTTGTSADMIFNIRENNNTDFTAELDTIGFQFRRFGTPLVNIYRNGKQENLFGLEVSGGATFHSTATLNDALTVTNGGIEINGASTFEDALELNGSLVANAGITSNWHVKLKNNAWLWSQYSPAHDELRLNANTAGGWDFYNQTLSDFANIRAKEGEFQGNATFQAGLVSNEAIKLGGTASYIYDIDNEILAGSDSGGYYLFTGADTNIAKPIYIGDNATFVRFKTSNFERYRIDASGNHDFKSGNASFGGTIFMYGLAETDRRLTFNGNIADTYNIYYYDEGSDDFHTVEIGGNSGIGTGLQVLNNGDVEVNGIATFNDDIEIRDITTPAHTSLRVLPNGNGNIYIGSPINGNSMYHYSNLNDTSYTTFTHNSTQSIFDSTHPAGFRFNKGIQVHGDIRTVGTFLASDGTPGYNGSFIAGAYDITVKDGLITNVVNIS